MSPITKSIEVMLNSFGFFFIHKRFHTRTIKEGTKHAHVNTHTLVGKKTNPAIHYIQLFRCSQEKKQTK